MQESELKLEQEQAIDWDDLQPECEYVGCSNPGFPAMVKHYKTGRIKCRAEGTTWIVCKDVSPLCSHKRSQKCKLCGKAGYFYFV